MRNPRDPDRTAAATLGRMAGPAPSWLWSLLPWVAGALLVVAALLGYVWLTAPTPDRLPTVYSVL